MLRFLPFYFTFLTLLCAPVNFALAEEKTKKKTDEFFWFLKDSEWEDPWIRNVGTLVPGSRIGIYFLGLDTCFPMSDEMRHKVLTTPVKDDEDTDEVDKRVERAARNGFLDRQCAEMFALTTGMAEVAIGVRATNALAGSAWHRIRPRSWWYMTPREWMERRNEESVAIRAGIDEGRRHRMPGVAEGESTRISKRFFATHKEKRIPLLDPALNRIGLGRKLDPQFTRGTSIAIELNDTQVIESKNLTGELPKEIKAALRNLSEADVAEFNKPGDPSRWRSLVSTDVTSKEYAFFLGVEEELKPEHKRNLPPPDQLRLGREFASKEAQEFYLKGREFVAKNNGTFVVELKHKIEIVSLDVAAEKLTRETLPDALVKRTAGRTLTGRAGPIHTKPGVGMILLGLTFLHGLNNLYTFWSGRNEVTRRAHTDFCSSPHCADYEGFFKNLSIKFSIPGIMEKIHSESDARRDQREPAELPAAPSLPPSAPAQ